MGILVIGAVFVDIKGYPEAQYIPQGRNVGQVYHVHGGVCRNVAEDIANVELRPTFLSLVDADSVGEEVVRKLERHKVDTRYIQKIKDGMGIWLAVFDNHGDVVASISKRPDLSQIKRIIAEHGDELFASADSIVVEIDMEPEILNPIFALAGKYHKEVYAVVSNMSIAMERRDLITKTSCFVCNLQEAGLLFVEDYDNLAPEQILPIIKKRAADARILRMVVTMGAKGAIYVSADGEQGCCPAPKVDVIDTTGAGDAFFSGVAIGLTYGKNLAESCMIGTKLASSVISTKESVCPRFRPEEFDLPIKDETM